MHGFCLRVDGIVTHRGADGVHVVEHIFADNHDGKPGRRNVLLRACIDHGKLGNIDGPRKNAGGKVRYQRHIARIGDIIPAGAVNRVVEADVDVVRIRAELKLFLARNAAEVFSLTRPGNIYGAVFFGFLGCLAGEIAGYHIICLVVFVHQVKRYAGELQRSASLHEDDLIVVWNPHHLAQLSFRLHNNVVKHLRTMAHLHYGHAAAFKVDEVIPRAFEHFNRKHRGAGGKIVDPVVKHYEFSCSLYIFNVG